jgi:hypothetical protein
VKTGRRFLDAPVGITLAALLVGIAGLILWIMVSFKDALANSVKDNALIWFFLLAIALVSIVYAIFLRG